MQTYFYAALCAPKSSHALPAKRECGKKETLTGICAAQGSAAFAIGTHAGSDPSKAL
jgi:hypothetical protein